MKLSDIKIGSLFTFEYCNSLIYKFLGALLDPQSNMIYYHFYPCDKNGKLDNDIVTITCTTWNADVTPFIK